MGCLSCGRGFHGECRRCRKGKCHPDYEKVKKTLVTSFGPGAPIKNPEDVTDPHSTGRKRAAHLYPLFRDKPCEWQGKKNVGGGHPIVGCKDGKQQSRHHGPIKNTLRNEPTNVHRICHTCHNRWHAVNNPLYDEEEYEQLPHNPETASDLEIAASEAEWRMKKIFNTEAAD